MAQKHIASCSFGKDSAATVLLAIEHEEPLDEAVYCRVMYSDEISGEIPEHEDFIHDVAIPYFEKHGIKTEILQSDRTYLDNFYAVVSKGARQGKIRGFAICGMCSICRDCKLPPIREYVKALPPDTVQYVGIATDEQERLLRLPSGRISLLDKYGVSEAMAFDLCKRHGMLSPIYDFTTRGGCWFCPNAKENELRHLYDYHPELWNELLRLQEVPNKCSELFNRHMRVSDIDANFKMDDEQMSLFKEKMI